MNGGESSSQITRSLVDIGWLEGEESEVVTTSKGVTKNLSFHVTVENVGECDLVSYANNCILCR